MADLDAGPPVERRIAVQRMSLLRRIEATMELPLALLGIVWLALLAIELTRGLSPTLTAFGTVIWAVFIVDFVIKLLLATDRRRFLRRNLITLVSLLVPALRVFRAARAVRIFRAARSVRGLRLLRLLTSVNRGMRSLRRTLQRRKFVYVVALTLLVLVGGAAGMFAFEHDPATGTGFASYGEALWWTAMILVALGSDYWPRTGEGRLLCLLLALYGFSIFGYVTAALASFFVSNDMRR